MTKQAETKPLTLADVHTSAGRLTPRAKARLEAELAAAKAEAAKK